MPITNVCGLRSRRFISFGGGAVGEWADSYVTNMTSVAALVATDGHRVGIRATNLSNIGGTVTPGNGASQDIVTSGAWDGVENAVRMYPPTALVLGEGQYNSILNSMDLSGGSKDIAQVNFRWTQFIGPRYYDLGSPTKVSGFQVGPSPGAATPDRIGIFEARDALNWSVYKYISVTANTNQCYHNPVQSSSGEAIDSGSDTLKLYRMFSSANHASSPPQVGNEWLCFEFVADVRQNRGNANGMAKLLCWTRDGVVSARYLQCALTQDPGWNFANDQIDRFEYLGAYWNGSGTANADNYTMFSHMTVAVNKAIGDVIGPPPGFVT